jgi:hypothetical protein
MELHLEVQPSPPGSLEEIPGIEPYIRKLNVLDIKTQEDLIGRSHTGWDRQALADKVGAGRETFDRFVRWAEIRHFIEIDPATRFYELLSAANADSVELLWYNSPHILLPKLLAINREEYIAPKDPTEEDVTNWYQQALSYSPRAPGGEAVKRAVKSNPVTWTTGWTFHYLLFGQGAGIDWDMVDACQTYIETFRVTIGFSYDHAAMGKQCRDHFSHAGHSSILVPGIVARWVTIIGTETAGNHLNYPVDANAYNLLTSDSPGIQVERVHVTWTGDLQAHMNWRASTWQPFLGYDYYPP